MCIVMVIKKGFTRFVDFRTPGEVFFVPVCGRIRHKVRMHFFFQNLLIYILLNMGILLLLRTWSYLWYIQETVFAVQ